MLHSKIVPTSFRHKPKINFQLFYNAVAFESLSSKVRTRDRLKPSRIPRVFSLLIPVKSWPTFT